MIEKIEQQIKEILEKIKKETPIEALHNNNKYFILFSTIHYNLKKIYTEKKYQLDLLYNKLYKDLKYNSNYNLNTKKEIEIFIFENQNYLKLYRETLQLSNLINYIENLLDILKSREYSLKNVINLQIEYPENI